MGDRANNFGSIDQLRSKREKKPETQTEIKGDGSKMCSISSLREGRPTTTAGNVSRFEQSQDNGNCTIMISKDFGVHSERNRLENSTFGYGNWFDKDGKLATAEDEWIMKALEDGTFVKDRIKTREEMQADGFTLENYTFDDLKPSAPGLPYIGKAAPGTRQKRQDDHLGSEQKKKKRERVPKLNTAGKTGGRNKISGGRTTGWSRDLSTQPSSQSENSSKQLGRREMAEMRLAALARYQNSIMETNITENTVADKGTSTATEQVVNGASDSTPPTIMKISNTAAEKTPNTTNQEVSNDAIPMATDTPSTSIISSTPNEGISSTEGKEEDSMITQGVEGATKQTQIQVDEMLVSQMEFGPSEEEILEFAMQLSFKNDNPLQP